MKHSITAAALVFGMMFTTQAMAQNISDIDMMVGDFAGVATADIQKLSNNKMLADIVNEMLDDKTAIQKELSSIKQMGIDPQKDIKRISVAVTPVGGYCASLTANIPLTALWAKQMANYTNEQKMTYKSITMYNTGDVNVGLLTPTTYMICERHINLKPIIDNVTSPKPTMLRQRDPLLYNALASASASADIRIAGKVTDSMKKEYARSTLPIETTDGKVKEIGAADFNYGSVSLDFSDGLKLLANANSKDASTVNMLTTYVTKELSEILKDPALDQLGLGFIRNAVLIAANGKNLNASITLNQKDIAQLTIIINELLKAPEKPAAPSAAAPTVPKAAPAVK